MILITSKRLRSIVSECRTEADVQSALRCHKIPFHFAANTGYLSIVVPCLTGKVRIYRCASKARPFNIIPVMPNERS